MSPVDGLWQPRSTCDAGCLPPPSRAVGRSVVLWRVVLTAGVLLAAVVLLPLLALLARGWLTSAQRLAARGVLAGLGVAHHARGELPRRGALLVANHVSWLDAVVILAHVPARLLAKREVRDWPVVGRLAVALGTVFVDRTRPRTLPTAVAEVRANLAAGGVVAVFPEGTTWCGRTAGPFRPAMFQAAVDAGVPVVPARLAFTLGGAPTTVAAFIGDETLLRSLRRVVGARGLTVCLDAHPRVLPVGHVASRRTLAAITHATLVSEPASLPAPVPMTRLGLRLA